MKHERLSINMPFSENRLNIFNEALIFECAQ